MWQRIYILLLSCFVLLLLGQSEAFVSSGNSQRPRRRATQLSIGNLLSGVTGIVPGKLLDASLLKQIVENTSLQGKDLQCVYKASKNGWSAVKFHECVDNQGSGLVVGLSRTGALFGGFNPLGWRSTDDYGTTNSAFLWFPRGNKIIKLPVYSGGNAAVFDYATGGPCFGAADLQIGPPRAAVLGGFAGPDMEDTNINAGNLKEGKSSVGGAYDVKNGWPVNGKFQIAEIEVYCSKNVRSSGGGGGLFGRGF